MENKVLVQVYVPELEATYDVYIPISKRIGNIVGLLIKAINDYGIKYELKPTAALYNRETGERYGINHLVYETNIRNGSQIVLI